MTAELPSWPAARAQDALVALASHAGHRPRPAELGDAPATRPELARWLDAAAGWLGIELAEVAAPHEALAAALRGSAPALLAVPTPRGLELLAVIGGERTHLVVVGPDLRRARIAIGAIAAMIARDTVAPVEAAAAATIDRAGLTGASRRRAIAGLVTARMRGRPHGGIWQLRRPPEAPLREQARDVKLGSRLAGVLAIHAVAQLAWVASWWAIGNSVAAGTPATGWLAAWALLFVTAQVGRGIETWWVGKLGLDASSIVSRRLLAGALRTDPDVLKRDGVGVALGRVLESSAVQTLAVTGGVQATLAAVEVVLAAGVLALGAGGWLHVALLVGILVTGGFGLRTYARRRRAWSEERLTLTHDLAEAMVGHATRLAQGDAIALANADDRALARYLTGSRALDRAQRRVAVGLPASWSLVAALGLAPVMVFGAADAGAIAIALGGIVYAADALQRLCGGSLRIADATIAWGSVADLFAAASTSPLAAPPGLALAPSSPTASALAVRGVGYRHRGRGAPVLAGCELSIARGERVLVEGASGAGKSTLAGILAGVRAPETGLVLVGGLDRASVGAAGWRRGVACAPQYHDNHLFTGTLAFNLLVGRRWPPAPGDLEAAGAMCEALGLAGVIGRMPAGLLEQVGETGWQLSHGEASRVFLARALLQGADLVLLDESLAALDPENLSRSLRCIEATAPTAIVIAHP